MDRHGPRGPSLRQLHGKGLARGPDDHVHVAPSARLDLDLVLSQCQ